MSFHSTLLDHLARYPAMQIVDLYKLIHQATLGSEHAVTDPEAARRYLGRELAEMGDGLPEPLLDPLSEETGIIRVHLRPYAAAGGDPDRLLEAFLRTANEFHGDTQTLERYWFVATDLGYFPADRMDKFIRSMRNQHYPAVHHSPDYQRLYRPAYRVVWRDVLGVSS